MSYRITIDAERLLQELRDSCDIITPRDGAALQTLVNRIGLAGEVSAYPPPPGTKTCVKCGDELERPTFANPATPERCRQCV
jgi:hypothetical protein